MNDCKHDWIILTDPMTCLVLDIPPNWFEKCDKCGAMRKTRNGRPNGVNNTTVAVKDTEGQT